MILFRYFYSMRLDFVIFLLLMNGFTQLAYGQVQSLRSEQQDFTVAVLMDDLSSPWGMAFLPDGDLLVTERGGKLRLVQDWRLVDEEISGLPNIRQHGQGGLMGIALHPDFENNRLLYLSYAGEDSGKYGTEVLRGELKGHALVNVETIFRAMPKRSGGRHFGSRLLFDTDGTLFISLGDRGASPAEGRDHPAQHLDSHLGSLIRINDDGSVPPDNPFTGQAGARPEIYTYGNRNMQGMAWHPGTGNVWTHEHGPQGGDEVNSMQAGVNYGWPVITYGVNYGVGTKIGEGTHKEGMQQPVYKWVPSIGPSGMMFYTGDKFPQWKGDLFVGSLKFSLLVRLELDGETVIREERLLETTYGRIRDIAQGPDGNIYLLTDAPNGKLVRISPAG